MFKFEISKKELLIFFSQHPRLAPAPDPTGVKILFARVPRIRIRVRVTVTVTVTVMVRARVRFRFRFRVRVRVRI